MGWAGGARLAGEVWGVIRDKLEPSDRQEVAQDIIACFRGEDADAGWEDEELLLADAGEVEDFSDDEDDGWFYEDDDDDFDDDDFDDEDYFDEDEEDW